MECVDPEDRFGLSEGLEARISDQWIAISTESFCLIAWLR